MFLYKANLQKSIKLIGIYQLFILQFIVIMTDGETPKEENNGCSTNSNGNSSSNGAYNLLTKVNHKLCPLCTAILQQYKQYCGQYYLGIVVPLVTLIVLILFFQYICIKCCRSSKSRKNKKKEADLRMNSFEPRYERPHRHIYHGHVYGESMQQSYMFPGDRMHPNKHRQQFLYEQAEEPRRNKKKKRKQSTDMGPKIEETNDDKNKTRPKKKKKKGNSPQIWDKNLKKLMMMEIKWGLRKKKKKKKRWSN